MKLKKIQLYINIFFKIAIKRMRINIKIKNKFIFNWKVKLKKINLVKGQKIKRIRFKIDIKKIKTML
jgi:hypothetical protein